MQTATLHHRTTERQRSRSSRSRPDSSSNLSELWERDEKFRQQVLEELIKDCIHMEVAGLVSGTMAVVLLDCTSLYQSNNLACTHTGTAGKK